MLASNRPHGLVYRVQLPLLPPTQLTNNTITPKSCNNNETALGGADSNCPTTSIYFDQDLRQLVGIIAQWAKTHLPQFNYTSSQFSLDYFQTSDGTPQGPYCIMHGNRCLGATADNDSYRGYNFGLLYPGAPTFVIGVNHSAGTEVTTTTPVNNATYTSISAADGAYNAGATDVAEINTAAAGFTQAPTLSGSASTVLSLLGIQQPTQFPHLNVDLPNLYIAIFERQPTGQQCGTPSYCDPGNPFVKVVDVKQKSAGSGYIPSNDTVLLTERGYVLPSTNASPPPMTNFSGAAAKFLESPYVLFAQPSSNIANSEMLKGLQP